MKYWIDGQPYTVTSDGSMKYWQDGQPILTQVTDTGTNQQVIQRGSFPVYP